MAIKVIPGNYLLPTTPRPLCVEGEIGPWALIFSEGVRSPAPSFTLLKNAILGCHLAFAAKSFILERSSITPRSPEPALGIPSCSTPPKVPGGATMLWGPASKPYFFSAFTRAVEKTSGSCLSHHSVPFNPRSLGGLGSRSKPHERCG